MRKTILFKTLNLLLAFTLILSSISGYPNVKASETVPVTGITLSKQSDTIEIASSIKLTANVEPVNATNKEVIWETDNPAVARVTNGIVRGYGEGNAVIKATTKDQGKTAYCIITVKKPAAATPIINVRADDDNNGIPDFIITTTPFIIEGRVSADFRTLVNNVLTGKIYVQDSTAGIAINGIVKELTLGTKIRISGAVAYNDGETQFLASSVETISTAIEAVKPAALSTKDSMLESKEGLLVKVQGKITKVSQGTVYVNDTTDTANEAKVITGNFFTVDTAPVSSTTTATTSTAPAVLKVGASVSATGIAAQDAAGHKLVIRNEKDITLATSKDEDDTAKDDTTVRLNKNSIVVKAGKFERINLLTKPGNAVITSVKIKTESPIVTISQDKKNKRLLTITPNKNITTTSQKLELEVVVNGKTYTLTLDVKIAGVKAKPTNQGHK